MFLSAADSSAGSDKFYSEMNIFTSVAIFYLYAMTNGLGLLKTQWSVVCYYHCFCSKTETRMPHIDFFISVFIKNFSQYNKWFLAINQQSLLNHTDSLI